MKIEVLYPEVCCLYGDKANAMYLQRCLPGADFVHTALADEPSFVSETPDLVYVGSMSEASQELLLELLTPHRDRLQELLESSHTIFLLTGNALELLGTYIQREDGTRLDGLGLVDMHTVRQAPRRFNSLVTGEFAGLTLAGYTSRFSHTYLGDDVPPFMTVTRGTGLNPKTKYEGVHQGNLYATYLLGPLLIANPDFTKHLLSKLGAPSALPFEDAVYQAYRTKLTEMAKPGLKLD